MSKIDELKEKYHLDSCDNYYNYDCGYDEVCKILEEIRPLCELGELVSYNAEFIPYDYQGSILARARFKIFSNELNYLLKQIGRNNENQSHS